jgi:cardiolipin synthase
MLTGILLTLAFVTIVVLVLVIWSIRRHRDPDLDIECDSPIEELVPSLAGLTFSSAIAGNSVEIFENGAYYDALVDAIRGARRTVHFETFLWEEGVLATRVAEALAERARAGVQVRLLVDAVGSKKRGAAVERQLKEAGCTVVKFHHRHIRNIGVIGERDHRKLVVLDGREAFVGGHCIKDQWLGDAQDEEHYADISVRVRGPIVGSVQAVFSENWSEETGEPASCSSATTCFRGSSPRARSSCMQPSRSPRARRRR